MFRQVVAPLLVGIVAAAGCTSDGTEPDGDAVVSSEVTAPISVTIPPERTTPFCAAMIELSERVVDVPDVDAAALITDAYRSILPEVPPEIETDFEAVLTELETGVPAPTAPPVTQPDLPPATDPDTGGTVVGSGDTTEFFFPSTTPAQRVNEYIEFACRDTENNPGPPATAPFDDDATDDG